MMKILLTGGAGYIGSVLCKKLLDEKFKVCVYDNLLFGGESLIPFLSDPNFSFIKGDTRDKKALSIALDKVDTVIHLAAIVGEHACKVHPKLANKINLDATIQISKFAKKHGAKRFIFASTCSNYGASEREALATEDSSVNPISLYAETKVEAESHVLALSDSKFTPTVLRFATVFGLSPRMRFDLLVSEFVKDAFIKHNVTVYKPDAWRPLIHVQDLADGVIKVLNASHKKINGQVFNIGFRNYKKRNVVDYIKLMLPETQIKYIENKGDDRDYRVSFEKAKKMLNFEAKINIKVGIDETINALKSGIFQNIDDARFGNYIW